jgi:hypothetical protein
MNTRWRQISRLITDKYDRWEYIGYSMVSDDKCPCCGGRVIHRSWHEEMGCVETDDRCLSCEYQRNWSYGHTSLQVGGWDGGYPYSTSDSDIEEIEKEFSRQIRLERSRRKDHRCKYYRRLSARRNRSHDRNHR